MGRPGQPPTDFHAPIDYVDRGGQRVPVSIMDRVDETLRQGAFLHDVAARIGFPVEQLREWRKVGMRASRAVLSGSKLLADLTLYERNCAELAIKMERAEAEGKLLLLTLAQRLARGGGTRTETTTEQDAQGNIIKTIRREVVAPPDSGMIRWMLERRFPGDFGRTRVEVSGPDGGPIQIEGEADGARSKLLEAIEAIRTGRSTSEQLATLGADSNGTNDTGNGTHP